MPNVHLTLAEYSAPVAGEVLQSEVRRQKLYRKWWFRLVGGREGIVRRVEESDNSGSLVTSGSLTTFPHDIKCLFAFLPINQRQYARPFDEAHLQRRTTHLENSVADVIVLHRSLIPALPPTPYFQMPVVGQRFKVVMSINAFQIPASRLTSRRLDRGLFRSRADAFRTIRTILRLSITLPTPSEYILDPSTCPNICSSNMMSSPSSLQTPMAVNRNLSSSLQAIPRRVPTVHPANVHFNE
uniref:Uncharacterized protein n=1 Tax=Moniliophthora roreri TaxID=221103 RepID=A0A0W0FDQ9_MONRR